MEIIVHSLTCLVNIPAFKRFLVFLNSFLNWKSTFLPENEILKFEIEIFIWKQDL